MTAADALRARLGLAPGGADGDGAKTLPLAAYVLLACLTLALHLPGFFTIPPFDRDESRFAQASSQMLASGDYVDIRFQDEARHKKPVGIYWLQAAATGVLSADPAVKEIWTYRIPSLLAATVAALATAWGGARLFGPAAGAAAGVMLASCVVLGVEARMAKTDATLTACVAVAQFALARFYVERNAPPGEGPGLGAALALWVAVGVGILIKGPLILLFSGGCVAALTLWDRLSGGAPAAAWLRALRWRLGLAVVLIAVAPWLIAITVKTGGAFFAESVGHDMMGKVAGGQEGKGLPPGYYLASFWITFFPWAFLAAAAAPWVWRNRADPAVRFCVAWIAPAWLVFEAVPTKLLHYTLPAFPAVALLSARALLDPAWGATAGGRRKTAFAAAALFVVGAVALCAAVAGFIPHLDGRFDLWAAVGAALAAAGFFIALRFGLKGRPQALLTTGTAAAFVLYLAAFGRALPEAQAPWPSRWAAGQIAALKPCPQSVAASAGYSEPSLVFLAGTATKLTRGDGAAAHLSADPACALALVESREEASFRTALNGRETQTLAATTAFNYNNGRRLTLTLYRLRP